MRLALEEAEKAFQKGEVPVGAVAVRNGEVLARSHNVREETENPLGHAEILLLQELSKKIGSWRLGETTVYVTLEPCLMCLGALLQARISRLVFGAMDPEQGVCGSRLDLSENPAFSQRMEIRKGVLEGESSSLLKRFFRNLRDGKRETTVLLKVSVLAGLLVLWGSPVGTHEAHHPGAEPGGVSSLQASVYQREIAPIFQKKCFDCHSANTNHPWYYSLPGARQLIDYDIREAREHIDMTDGFPFKGHGTAEEDLKELEKVILKDKMPLWRYRLLHRDSSLTEEEKETILRWIRMGEEEG